MEETEKITKRGKKMKKRIVSYRSYVDSLLESGASGTDWQAVGKEHLTRLSFFQQERLLHLLVTMLTALLEVLCAVPALLTGAPALLLLSAVLLLLLVPYLLHYYLLENEVQKMYGQYDRIRALAKAASGE